MRPGDIGVDDERQLFTIGGHRPFRYDGLTVQSPRAVESTEGRAFDVVLFGLTPAAAALFFPARALRLADLPFRVGRLKSTTSSSRI